MSNMWSPADSGDDQATQTSGDPFDIFGGEPTSPSPAESPEVASADVAVEDTEYTPEGVIAPPAHDDSGEEVTISVSAPATTGEFTGNGEFADFIDECIAIAEEKPLYGSRDEHGFRFNNNARAAIHALMEALLDHSSTEVLMVGPDDLAIKAGGEIQDLDVAFTQENGRADSDAYHHFINEVVLAQFSDSTQRVGDGSPDIEADFIAEIDEQDEVTGELVFAPARARVHCLCPPYTDTAVVTFAKKARVGYTLDRMVANGTLTAGMANLLVAAIQAGLVVVFSGGTGSGKTTTLQALGQYFPKGERIALIEDRQEIILPKDQRIIHMAFDRNAALGGFGSLAWAVNATTRMRIQRVIVGETIGSGFAEFCNVANSGVEGCMTTIHANDTRRALDKMEKLYGGPDSSRLAVVKDIARTVDLIVQQKLVNGRHVMVGIEEVSNTINESGMVITEALYAFNGKEHVQTGRLSDYVIERLRDRKIPVEELEVFTRPFG